MKIGRNDPCYCKSGKKYKKCCLNKEVQIPLEVLQKMRAPEPFDQNGQLIGRPVISTEFKDKKVVAVGSRLYHSLPLNITFHEFLITFLKDTVGPIWGQVESQKPIDKQHIIVQWIAEMAELIHNSKNVIDENPEREIKSAPVSGNVQALLSLAYDIYSVYHCTDLPDELVARLKIPDQFQGAKYEIAVAVIFARAGFNIQWLPKSPEKHCEFIATHKYTNEQIIVEAKSRHRQGVLNRPGQREDITNMKAQVGHLFNKALSKPTNNLPFMIFVDLNLPLTEGANLQKRWVKDIQKMLDTILPKGTIGKPDPFTSLFVTNFSWHYHAQETDIRRGEMVTIIPLFPKIRTRNQNTITLLHQATEQYGSVPPMFPEGN